MNFIVSGLLITLCILGAGAFAYWIVGRNPRAPSGKRRHRDEARLLQVRFDEDADFARNFHRPTQNEVLETLQTLDQLTPAWEQDDPSLADRRFKNELAESFPSLRRGSCEYPGPIAEDVARLFGKAKMTPAALALRMQNHAQEMTRRRGDIQSVRAQANALHQLASGPDIGPVELTPGSLPFRPSDEPTSNRSYGRALAGTLALGACLLAALYIAKDPGLRGRVQALWVMAKSKGAVADDRNLANGPSQTAEDKGVVTTPTVPEAKPVTTTESSTSGNPPEPTVAVVQTEAAPAVNTTVAPVPTAQLQVASPPPPEAFKPNLAQQIAESKLRAIDKHPDLAVPNSEINLRFVFRYKSLVALKSARLQDPNWPEQLAEECAAAAVSPKKKLTQVTAVHH